jgi:glycosyltransferase involved in cell wall biosynthesis
VIYLAPANPDFQTERTVRLLQRDLGVEFQITRFAVGNAISSALRLWKEDSERVVHAWGDAALKAAAICRFQRIIYSPPSELREQLGAALRIALGQPSVHIVYSSEAARRLGRRPGDVIPPGVELDRIPTARDQKLRRELGFEDTDFVVLACGESTSPAAHRIAAWATSILHVIDPRHRLLAWGRGPQTGGLVRFGRRLQQPKLVTLAQQTLCRSVEWEELVSVADVLLVTASELTATLPICIAMAAGLPVIANSTPLMAEIQRDVTLVPEATPKTLAQAIYKLSQAPASRRKSIAPSTSDSVTQQWRELYLRLGAGQNRLSSSRY